MLRQNPETVSHLYEEYFKLCQSDEHDMHEYATIYESTRSNPALVDAIEDFKNGVCAKCKFENKKRRKFIFDSQWDEWSLKFVEDWVSKLKPPEQRNMIPSRGKLSWSYICEKCFEKKGDRK